MPTSVLLAVLAAAGLLALAPALVRRYDATERLVVERELSTARVISRQRRRRTVPTRRGFRLPPSVPDDGQPVSSSPDAGSPPPSVIGDGPARPLSPVAVHAARAEKARLWRYRRRRRVLAALLLLNAVELLGVVLFDAGLWLGFAVSASLLCVYTFRLRGRVLAERAERRLAAHRAREAAAREAERIARERRERQELLEAAEQAAAAARRGAAAHRSYRRRVVEQRPRTRPALRGASYEARAAGY